MKYFLIIAILGGLFLAGYLLFFANNHLSVAVTDPAFTSPYNEIIVNIESGQTFSTLTEEVGIGSSLMNELLIATEEVYDLTRLRAGRDIKFYFDKQSNELQKVIYQIDTEEELYIFQKEDMSWSAERRNIDYEIKIRTVSGVINSSLYESALEQNIDIRAIIDLADVFAWTVDFGMGIRQGDTYKFIFEERYRQGEYIMPGKILAAQFVNDGKIIEGYYFSEGLDENGKIIEGYYHPDGNSVQKIFLKNPVSFKYISSGYTTGPRYISAFSAFTSSHMAIDYAAATGSPIRAVGDGQIVSAGWNGAYGNFVSIRHNETFTTNYAHLQKIYVKYGQYVSQSDIIGTVGSTGYSTGPHLHFEMVKYGTKINPLTVDLPSDKAVSAEKMNEFTINIKQWQEILNN